MTIMEIGPAPQATFSQELTTESIFAIPESPTNPLECVYTGITHPTLPSHEARDEIERAKLAAAEKYSRLDTIDIAFGRSALELCAASIAAHKQGVRASLDSPLAFAQPVPKEEPKGERTQVQPYSENPSAYFEQDAA